MRKLIVCNIMSIDGFIAGPGDDVRVMPIDQAFESYIAERLRTADYLLLGRVTFEGFKNYWPKVVNNLNSTLIQREIAWLNESIEKLVVSDSLSPDQLEPWNNTRIFRRADVPADLAALKRQDGGDILVLGSQTLWNDLVVHGLADELHLMVAPLLLGSGLPVYHCQPVSLQLNDMRTWSGSDNVLMIYAVVRDSW